MEQNYKYDWIARINFIRHRLTGKESDEMVAQNMAESGANGPSLIVCMCHLFEELVQEIDDLKREIRLLKNG